MILSSLFSINEPGIQAIFIRKIVRKCEDSRSMFVHVIRHVQNICSVPMYTSVCPNRNKVWYTLGQKKSKSQLNISQN